jgi:hypothetical protein
MIEVICRSDNTASVFGPSQRLLCPTQEEPKIIKPWLHCGYSIKPTADENFQMTALLLFHTLQKITSTKTAYS